MEKCAALPAPTGPSALPGPNDCATAGVRNARSVAVQRLWRRTSDQQLGDSPFDLRRRRLTVVGAVSEIVIPDEVTAALRERHSLGTDCERLVFGIRVREDGRVVLAATDGDLYALIDSLAAEANHETSQRRQRRLDAAFDALSAAAQTLKSG